MTEFYIIEKDGSFSLGRLEFWSGPDRMDCAIDVTDRNLMIPPETVAERDDYRELPVLKRADFDAYAKIQKVYTELMALRARLIDAGLDFDPVIDRCDLTGDNKKDIPVEFSALKAFAAARGVCR